MSSIKKAMIMAGEDNKIPVRGLEFYCPFEQNFTDIINNLSGTANASYFKIQEDTTSNIGKYLWCNVTYSIQSNALHYDQSETLCQFQEGDFTISFWVQAPSWNQTRDNVLFSKKGGDRADGLVIFRDGAQRQKADARGGDNNPISIYTGSNFENPKWIHWCLIRQGQTVSWYKNGVLDSTTEISSTANCSSNQKIHFGWNKAWFTCAIYNLKAFRIYNRAITSKERTLLANEFNPIYTITANDQTINFSPVKSETKAISYSTPGTITNFQIISGSLPSNIYLNTATGEFTGYSIYDEDHVYNLVIKMTGNDVVQKTINVTINAPGTSQLSIQSQSKSFITESAESVQITYSHEDGDLANIQLAADSNPLPSGVTLRRVTSGNNATFYLDSDGTQTTAINSYSIKVNVYSQYHPNPVTAIINVTVRLNVITVENKTLKFYVSDGAISKQVKYTTQKQITPVFSYTGTLPNGFSFDTTNGIISYDGIYSTPTQQTIDITVSSSTGCSISDTASYTIILQQTNPIPNDYVVYCSLSSKAQYAQTGQEITYEANYPSEPWNFITYKGIDCLACALDNNFQVNGNYRRRLIISDNNINLGANTSRSYSVWIALASRSPNNQCGLSLGAYTGRKTMQTPNNANNTFSIMGGGNSQDYGRYDINQNQWYNVVVTYDGSNGDYNLYVDGVLRISQSNTSFDIDRGIISFGSNTTGRLAECYFAGYVSSGRLYNRVLSSSEIQALAQQWIPTN